MHVNMSRHGHGLGLLINAKLNSTTSSIRTTQPNHTWHTLRLVGESSVSELVAFAGEDGLTDTRRFCCDPSDCSSCRFLLACNIQHTKAAKCPKAEVAGASTMPIFFKQATASYLCYF